MEIFERIASLNRAGTDFVVVTVVETSGSVPATVGSRMVVTSHSIEGTVGGGATEKDMITKARDLLQSGGKPYVVTMETEQLEMQCGGEITVFVEPFIAKAQLWVFGGGHIAYHLVPLAASIGFRVVVVDERPEFSGRERFPHAFEILNISYSEGAERIVDGSYVVILTHKHVYDRQVLQAAAAIDPPLPYIGMIGSRKKVTHTFSTLQEAGVDIGENIYSPIGLDIGGGSPAEIAVAITAELQGVLHGKRNLPHCR